MSLSLQSKVTIVAGVRTGLQMQYSQLASSASQENESQQLFQAYCKGSGNSTACNVTVLHLPSCSDSCH